MEANCFLSMILHLVYKFRRNQTKKCVTSYIGGSEVRSIYLYIDIDIDILL